MLFYVKVSCNDNHLWMFKAPKEFVFLDDSSK